MHSTSGTTDANHSSPLYSNTNMLMSSMRHTVPVAVPSRMTLQSHIGILDDLEKSSLNLQFGEFGNMQTNSVRRVTATEPASSMLKTPVSLLNEVCAKAQVTPTFETSEDGPPHARIFECTVTVKKQGLCWEGKGVAKAKKDARQEAAKTLLVSMDSKVLNLLIPTSVKSEPEEVQPMECDPDIPGNPVGELNDLCMKIKRLPPDYEDVGEEGRPHERIYSVACKLGSQITEVGRGRSKKQAKKVAAHKVKESLTEMMKKGSSPVEDEVDINIVEKLQQLTLVKKQGNDNKNWKLKDWFAEFKERSGEKLLSLQNPAIFPVSCHKRMLGEIAEEQKFKIEYHDIENSPESEGFSSIVSVGMEPVAIFLGKGRSKTEARKNAAEKAVEFLTVAVQK